MITEKNNVFYCDCGFSFQRGRSGSHDCADGLRNKLVALEARCAALAAELSAVEEIHNEAVFITDDHYEQCPPEVQKIIRSLAVMQIPAYQAFLAEVRASAIPEGYVLVPQEMHLSSEAMEGICFHCGDGDHNFGEFTDGTLFVGDVDYGDGKKVHGLHIATADYPEEGCATICEFAAQLRKGVQS